MKLLAPAKINLYLQITGKRPNGYHEIDSLMTFADIGDEIEVRKSDALDLKITGPFAQHFSQAEQEAGPASKNLIIKAARALARAIDVPPTATITLTKNLPLGAGIGGGSSDTATTLWALCTLWNIPKDADFLPDLMLKLGADVPVCFTAQAARVRGIGEVLDPVPAIPETPALLIYPGKPCSTKDVFLRYDGAFSEPSATPPHFKNLSDVLQQKRNDLTKAAIETVPDIANVLHALDVQEGCTVARMSGSGSSCFGLFKTENAAQHAATHIKADNPDWWVKPCWIGRTERY